MGYFSIFCFIVAAIIVATKLILEFMESRDKAKGMITNHEEYRMGGILKIMWKERWASFKNLFKRKKKENK